MEYVIGGIIGMIIGGIGGYLIFKWLLVDTSGKVEILLNDQIKNLKQDISDQNQKLEFQKNENQKMIVQLAKMEGDQKAKEQVYQKQEQYFKNQIQETKENHEKAIKGLREAFTAMSAEALKNNNTEFLKLAQENFNKNHEAQKNDYDLKQKNIETLLTPLQESLKQYQERLQLA